MAFAAQGNGLVTWLRGLMGRRAAGAPAAPAPPAPAIVATVVTFGGRDGEDGDGVAALLEGRDGLAVTRATAAEGGPDDSDPAKVVRLRHLVAESAADVAVWVEGHPGGARLRWIGASHPDEERPGGFGAQVRLDLPPDPAAAANLAYAATLAAMQPADGERRGLHRRLLEAAAGAAAASADNPPAFATPVQRASLRLCYAHVAAAAAMAGDAPVAWLERAVEAYRAGLADLRPDDLPPAEEATIQRRRAAALTALAEHKGDDPDCLAEAVDACRAAAEVLPRALLPGEWAAEQVRLGMALYRLDLRTGDATLLRDAIGAFQAALQVFTRAEAPARWAEAMHNLAVVLEVYGDQSRNVEILRKAVAASRAVLEVRTPDGDRAGWAATLNTLGFALFLLDKHGDAGGNLDEAAELLRTAAATFRELGAAKPAEVAERNLAHVDRLNRQRRDRPAADPGWADAPGPAADG